MYTVYSTTKSSELYPVNVLIVDGFPALAVKVPERLVVIPIEGVTPVKFEPSPENDVAVTTPAITAPPSLKLTPIPGILK